MCVFFLSSKHKIQNRRFKQICSALSDEITSFFFAFQQFKDFCFSLFLSFLSVSQNNSFGAEDFKNGLTDFQKFGVEAFEIGFRDFTNSELKLSRSDSEVSFEIARNSELKISRFHVSIAPGVMSLASRFGPHRCFQRWRYLNLD